MRRLTRAFVKNIFGTDYNKTVRTLLIDLVIFWGLRTSGLIHYKALMNAIWSRFPEYAAAYNAQEQLSLHDSFGLLLHAVGCETELKASPDRMIALSPEEQVPYLNI